MKKSIVEIIFRKIDELHAKADECKDVEELKIIVGKSELLIGILREYGI